MAKAAGFLVDLTSVKFEESNGVVSSWIQGMTTGKYQHPLHGEINITPERVKRFADNVNNNVRGTELDIDYDHKSMREDAAGWVKKAEARNDGLWLFVEWTDEAANKIKGRQYKYFSPEFDDEWTHPKSGKKFQDVLFGGGLTNRPFLKDILPINLSEVFASDEQVATNKGGQMDPKKLRELLGLPEDATDEQVTAKLTERLTEKPEEKPAPKEELEEETKVELSEEITKLLAENPSLKALTDQLTAQQKQLAEMSVALRLAEVDTQVSKLSDTAQTKGRVIPPAVADSLKALLIKSPKELSDEVLKTMTALADTGFVELGERGSNRQDGEGDAVKKFNEGVKKLQEENKDLSYADAVEEFARQNPKTFTEYQQNAYAFRV